MSIKQNTAAVAMTVKQIEDLLRNEVSSELITLLKNDTRRGVQILLQKHERMQQQQLADLIRVQSMYAIERDLEIKYGLVAGVDEAGRGPLTGPVAAAAVVLKSGTYFPGLNDSKKLTAEQRERLAVEIKDKSIAWAVTTVSAAEIDNSDILQASLKAMVSSVYRLKASACHVLVDGNQRIKDLEQEQTTIKSGDARCACIAAASILAKVHRDNLMIKLAKLYPVYGFERNKGYPTEEHLNAIKRYGPCPQHRMSFEPLKSAGAAASQ